MRMPRAPAPVRGKLEVGTKEYSFLLSPAFNIMAESWAARSSNPVTTFLESELADSLPFRKLLELIVAYTKNSLTLLIFLTFFLVQVWGTSHAYGGEEGLWLEEARIRVVFRPDGKKEVRQVLRVRPKGSRIEGGVGHWLFLGDSESVSNWKIETHQHETNVDLEKRGQGLETVFWVGFNPLPESSVSYELSFEVETDELSRCPLAVPLAVPIDPHSPVLLEVELPPGQEVTGMTFPNLIGQENLLTGWMGGIPTYLSVPHGKPGSEIWWNRHGVDLFVLLLIAASMAIWMRYRTGLAEPGEDESQ